MQLGAFSIRLAVEDLEASRILYETITDTRSLLRELKAQGVTLQSEADEYERPYELHGVRTASLTSISTS
jgi:hypothetical protein